MIPLFRVSMHEQAAQALDSTLRSGYIGQGPRVEEIEGELTEWFGQRPVTVNSGTSAITMALRLAGVGPGDKVITTPMTCAATNLPILSLGATPVWADVDARTGLIDPYSVGARIDRFVAIKAIVAVDWGGAPADYDTLRAVAGERPIIEDAAHAFGAKYKDRPIGSVADYTCFSFQAIKHLTTGDGGALTLPESQRKRAKDMRWFGLDRDNQSQFRGNQDIVEWGYKFHMNDINAKIGLKNLEIVDGVLASHRDNATVYDELLDERFTQTQPRYNHLSSAWLYTVLLPTSPERDEFIRYMAGHQVQVSQVHWRTDRLTAFADHRRTDLPGVDVFADRMVCLPVHPDAPAVRIANIANSFFREYEA